MNKEEIKEYLKRTDELELKLTGEDKDTYQWLLFGYNECARLLEEKEQENNQLKERIRILAEHPFLSKIRKEDKSVIKELRSWLEEEIKQRSKYDRWAFEDTLDKLNELEEGKNE